MAVDRRKRFASATGMLYSIMVMLEPMTFLWMLWWMIAAEAFFSALGWRGLTLLGQQWAPVVTLPLCIIGGWLLIVYGRPLPWIEGIASAIIGLLLFFGLVLWRQRGRTSQTVLAPGEREGRRISQVDIPIVGGPLPALLVEPLSGSSVGVLVIHGAGVNKGFFSWPLLHDLADAGMAACSIDVDGHGDNPRILNFPAVLDDVAAGVAWLRERYEQVAVVGVSIGGCIAARAIADGIHVDALVIMEAPIAVRITKATRWHEARTLALPATWALHRDIGTLGIIRGWYYTPTRTKIGTIDLIERLDLAGSVARIGCPLLLCYAKNDAVVPLDQAHAVAAVAPPGTPLVVIPFATHLSLMIDRRAIRSVCDWLCCTLNMVNEQAEQ